jgi:hypothetical protein
MAVNGMTDQPGVRREVVEALLRVDFGRPLSGPETELLYNSTAAERAAVAHWHAHEATRLLEEAGVIKIPTALDLRGEDVDRMARQTSALQHARHELSPFWRPVMTLGEALKVAGRVQAGAAVRALRRVGFREFDDWSCASRMARKAEPAPARPALRPGDHELHAVGLNPAPVGAP